MRAFGWSMQERNLYDGIPTLVHFFPGNARLLATVWDYFARIDDIFNDFNDRSEVGRVNANSSAGTVEISQALADAVAFSLKAGDLAQGAFDITLGPLRNLWRAHAREGVVPAAHAVAQAKARVGHHNLQLNGRLLTRKVDGMRLDLGGVIKGLAVDHAMTLLRAASVEAAFVQMGTETATFGLSPHGRPHRLTFETAAPSEFDSAYLVDPGTGMSGSSSANSARFIRVGDVAYYHIFDPRTGAPIPSEVVQVSVYFPHVGANGLAEVLTKSCAILGFERTAPILASLGAEAMCLQRRNGGVSATTTSGWGRFMKRIAENDRGDDFEPTGSGVS